MTEQQYAAKLINVKKRYERKYYGSVFLALRKQKAPIKAALKNRGAAAAIAEVMNMSAKPVEDALRKLYKEIGPYEAEREYRRLKRFQKGLGEPSFDWLSDIFDFFDRFVLDQVRGPMLAITQQRVMRILQEGISTGQSIDDMVKSLADTELDKVRARLIVRTEANRAMNAGHNLSVTHIGFPVKKVWVAARDPRTRGADGEDKSDHYHMNGQAVAYEEPFTDPRSGRQLMFPGDTSLGAGASDVINCRCTVIHKPASGVQSPTVRPMAKPKPIEPPKPVFVPAKSIEEAEDWARKNIIDPKRAEFVRRENDKINEWLARNPNGRAEFYVDVSYKGIPLDVANEINRTIKEEIDFVKMPPLNRIQAKAIKKEQWAARMGTGGDLEINTKYFKGLNIVNEAADVQEMRQLLPTLENAERQGKLTPQYAAVLKRAREILKYEYSGAATNNMEIVRHELGHHLDNNIKKISEQKGLNFDEIKQMIGDAMKETQKDEYKYKLSYYAFSNIFNQREEIFAEAFTHFRAGRLNQLAPSMRSLLTKITQ